ncbi:MAG: 50S ribosomal protein L10 [Bacteroidota bacterium]
MTKSEKAAVIEELKQDFQEHDFFYIADASTMTVGEVNELRGKFFEKDVQMKVVKNTLAIKALEAGDASKGYEALYDSLKGPSALLFTKTANIPAKVIKDFRGKGERPIIKAAYIDSGIFIGDDQIDALASLKSKEELLGEIVNLLQSPAKNVISALKSGGSTIAGLVKALEERG